MIEPTRQLEKIGLRFSVLIPARFNADMFAGICLANGCDFATARRIADELAKAGERLTTIRPLRDWETFKAACKAIGVHVEEIPPR